MKQELDAVEAISLRLLKLPSSWLMTLFAMSAQILIILFASALAPQMNFQDKLAEWEANVMRYTLFPGIVCLYLKAIVYLAAGNLLLKNKAFVDTAAQRKLSFSPARVSAAAIIVLALDNIILLIVPVVLNFREHLSVLERGLEVYCIAAIGTALFAVLFYWLLPRVIIFGIAFMAVMAWLEYASVWLSREYPGLPLFNDLYNWNRVFPSLKTHTVVLNLYAYQLYNLLFFTVGAVALLLLIMRFVYRGKAQPGR